jgi:hypothetical protein
VSEAKRLKQLDDENTKLKKSTGRMHARPSALRERLSKNGRARQEPAMPVVALASGRASNGAQRDEVD